MTEFRSVISCLPCGIRRPLIGGAVILLVALAFGFFRFPAAAQGIAKLSDADRFDISRIENYLNRIKTLQARFLQVTSDGDYSEGDFYFSKPGKMRLNYDSPSSIVILSDGVNLGYYDKELEYVTYINLERTQASILLRERISFSAGDFLVTAFERSPGVLRLTVIKGDDPLEGNITLIFSDHPLGLKKWRVTDAQGVVTNVSLLDPRFDVPLNLDLFHVEPPDETTNLH